jgi:hypothetical protein
VPDLLSYLPALIGTILLELIVCAAWARRGHRALVALASIGLNLVSHPLATAALVFGWSGFPAVEAAVVCGEAIGLAAIARVRAWRAVCMALSANALTVVASFFWWLGFR